MVNVLDRDQEFTGSDPALGVVFYPHFFALTVMDPVYNLSVGINDRVTMCFRPVSSTDTVTMETTTTTTTVLTKI